MKQLLFVFIGGGFGALSRFALSGIINKKISVIFPFGTLAVNLLGCFLIGFFFDMFDRTIVPTELRAFILMGFLGAFTTFSTFTLETVNLLRDGEISPALINIFVSNLAGVVLVFVGVVLSRAVMRTI